MTNFIEIYSPRYHDRTVLLAGWRISTGHPANIRIKYGAYKGNYVAPWKALKEATVTKMKTKTGRLMEMLVVPLDSLERQPDEN